MASKPPFETHHHIVPISVYVKVILTLLVLMVITVVVGQIQLPSVGPISGTVLNQFIALAIAVTKASLVVLFFMGVRWSTQLTKLWAILGFAWLSFFTIMWGDYGTRGIEQVQGWEQSGPRAPGDIDGPSSALPRTYGDHQGMPSSPNDINVRPRG